MVGASIAQDFFVPAVRPPHHLLFATEVPRAVADFVLFFALRPLLGRLPAGDGHAVVVLPGYLADDEATRPLRGFLCRLGYRAVGWDLGRNDVVNEQRFDEIAECIRRTSERSGGGKVSLVGWSLGGVLAREVACRRPELIRQVISLGSPLSNDPKHYRSFPMFTFGDRGAAAAEYFARRGDVVSPPPVPSTSIFSRSDGVVPWRAALQHDGPDAENVEVHASHFGITVNPFTIAVIADRLAQREDAWAPFRRSGWQARFFPSSARAHGPAQAEADRAPAQPVARGAPAARPVRTACGTLSRTAARPDRESRAGSATARLRCRW